MQIDTNMLSKLRGVGVGAVLTAYVTMCFGQFGLTFCALIVALVVDLIIVWKKFETISERIHSWLGGRGDMIVNVAAFAINIYFLRDHTFLWWQYAVASAFWVTHGHLWWNSNR